MKIKNYILKKLFALACIASLFVNPFFIIPLKSKAQSNVNSITSEIEIKDYSLNESNLFALSEDTASSSTVFVFDITEGKYIFSNKYKIYKIFDSIKAVLPSTSESFFILSNKTNHSSTVFIKDEESNQLKEIQTLNTNDLEQIFLNDLNNDSKLDIAVNEGNNYSIFINNGDNTFTSDISRDYEEVAKSLIKTDKEKISFPVDFQYENKESGKLVLKEKNYSLSSGLNTTLKYSTLSTTPCTIMLTQTMLTSSAAVIDSTTADINNDGRADIVSIIGTNNNLLIRLGMSNGTFQESSLAINGATSKVLCGYFDSDTNLDLIGFRSSICDIYLGNGQGGFTFLKEIPLPTSSRIIRQADFDADNKADIVINEFVTSLTQNIYVLLSSKSYLNPSKYTTSILAGNIEIGDFNGDRKKDLAITNGQTGSQGNTINLLFNNGSGRFFPIANSTIKVNNFYPYSITVDDLNNDKKSDIVLTRENYASNAIRDIAVILSGETAFKDPSFYVFGIGNSNLSSFVQTGDINNDGNIDIIATAPIQGNSTNHLSVLLNKGDGTFLSGSPTNLNNTRYKIPTNLLVNDFNGDSKEDITLTYNRTPSDPTTTTNDTVFLFNNSVCPTSSTSSSSSSSGISCGQGQILCGNVCRTGNCCNDSQCTSGQICTNNSCSCSPGQLLCNGACKIGNCCDNSQCTSGKICTDNFCSCPSDKFICDSVCITGNCCYNSHCTSGKICTNNTCSCPSGKLLCNGACKVGNCCENFQCTSGQICTNNTCTCPTGQVLINGSCANGNCTSNAQCTSGQACLNSFCTCPSDQILCNGACKVGNCCADTQCRGGQICAYNTCICPYGKVLVNDNCVDGNCTSNEQCTSGQSCLNNFCSCPQGQILCGGLCKIGDCCDSPECSSGRFCINNTCSCPQGQIICDGVCKIGNCCDSSQCSSGQACLQNYCPVTAHTCKVESNSFRTSNGGCKQISKNLVWDAIAPQNLIYSDASLYCNNREVNGYNDWRLPTKQELKDAGSSGGALNHFNFDVGDVYKRFWSTSIYVNSIKAVISLFDGFEGGAQDSLASPVVCVRYDANNSTSSSSSSGSNYDLPIATNISPSFGPKNSNNQIAISGFNLNSVSKIAFSNQEATILQKTNNQITALTPTVNIAFDGILNLYYPNGQLNTNLTYSFKEPTNSSSSSSSSGTTCQPNQIICGNTCKTGNCCDNSQCSGGQVCTNNSCICPSGQLLCDGACKTGNCCTNSQCTNGKTCINNSCTTTSTSSSSGITYFCNDSDNGNVTSIKGTLTTNYPGWTSPITDTCITKDSNNNTIETNSCVPPYCWIKEFFCDGNNMPRWTQLGGPNLYCNNGAISNTSSSSTSTSSSGSNNNSTNQCTNPTQNFQTANGGCEHKPSRTIFSKPFSNQLNWDAANIYCLTLNQGGFDDWTLPSHMTLSNIENNYFDIANVKNIPFWLINDNGLNISEFEQPIAINGAYGPDNATNENGVVCTRNGCPAVCNTNPWENNSICNLSTDYFLPNQAIQRTSPTYNSFDLKGNIGYTGNSGFSIQDLTNPLNIKQLGYRNGSYYAIKTGNNYAYLINRNQILERVDITNPQNLNNAISLGNIGTALDLSVDNDKAYVPIPDSGLKVYSGDSAVLSNIYLNGSEKVIVKNNLAYIADISNVDIYDVSNPTNSIRKSRIDHVIKNVYNETTMSWFRYDGDPVQIILKEDFLYLLLNGGNYGDGRDFGAHIIIYNVSNPSSPQKISVTHVTSQISTPSTFPSFDVNNNHLYLYNPEESKLDIYNVSNPSSPREVASLNSDNIRGQIKVTDKYAFLTTENRVLIYQVLGCGSSLNNTSSSSGSPSTTTSSSSGGTTTCQVNQILCQGQCKTGNCCTNSQCTSGQICNNNSCSCPLGQLLCNGLCKTGNCCNNTQCTSGQLCSNFQCQCPSGTVFSNGSCIVGNCLTSANCSSNKVCINNSCSCQNGQILCSDICTTGDCCTNAQCGSGKVCSNNSCINSSGQFCYVDRIYTKNLNVSPSQKTAIEQAFRGFTVYGGKTIGGDFNNDKISDFAAVYTGGFESYGERSSAICVSSYTAGQGGALSHVNSNCTPLNISIGPFISSIEEGDLNLDNFSDIVVGTPNTDKGGKIHLLKTIADGSRSVTSTLDGPSYGLIGDVNNDGENDIVGVHEIEGKISTYFRKKGQYDFDFSNPPVLTTLPAGNSLIFYGGGALGKLNNDPYLDLIFTNADPTQNLNNKVSILYGKGDGTFQAPIVFTTTPSLINRSVHIEDLNKDGRNDFLVFGEDIEPNYDLQPIHPNNGVTVFLATSTSYVKLPVFYIKYAPEITVANFNNDSFPDILFLTPTSNGTGALSICYGKGNGTFMPPSKGYGNDFGGYIKALRNKKEIAYGGGIFLDSGSCAPPPPSNTSSSGSTTTSSSGSISSSSSGAPEVTIPNPAFYIDAKNIDGNGNFADENDTNIEWNDLTPNSTLKAMLIGFDLPFDGRSGWAGKNSNNDQSRIRLDYIDDQINLGKSSDLPLTGDYTFSFWVNLNETAGTIYSDRQFNSNYSLGTVSINPQRNLELYRCDEATNPDFPYTRFTGKTQLSKNTWYQITFTKSNNKISLYLNGLLDGSKIYNTPYNAKVLGDRRLIANGSFGNFRIYNTALSEEQVKKLYSNESSYFATSPPPSNLTGIPPTITKISPTYGPSAGGNEVIITGTNLGRVTRVEFISTPVTITNRTDTEIKVLAAPQEKNQPAGSGANVRLYNSFGYTNANSSSTYKYIDLATCSGTMALCSSGLISVCDRERITPACINGTTLCRDDDNSFIQTKVFCLPQGYTGEIPYTKLNADLAPRHDCKINSTLFSSTQGGCRDLMTGLVWDNISAEKLTYKEAWSYCKERIIQGNVLDDWRLPTKDEILTISGKVNGTFNFNTNNYFWTSTNFPQSTPPATYYTVNPSDNKQSITDENIKNYVFCVRGKLN